GNIMDLFSTPSPGQLQPAAARPPGPSQASVDIMSSLSSSPGPAPQAVATSQPAAHPCYNANDINVTMQVQRNAEGMIQATARFQNTSPTASLSNVGLQAA